MASCRRAVCAGDIPGELRHTNQSPQARSLIDALAQRARYSSPTAARPSLVQLACSTAAPDGCSAERTTLNSQRSLFRNGQCADRSSSQKSLQKASSPCMQVVNAQHGLDGERWTTALGAGAGACGAMSYTNSARGTTRFISSGNSRLRVLLVLRSNPLSLRLIYCMPSLSHIGPRAQRFCRPSLETPANKVYLSLIIDCFDGMGRSQAPSAKLIY